MIPFSPRHCTGSWACSQNDHKTVIKCGQDNGALDNNIIMFIKWWYLQLTLYSHGPVLLRPYFFQTVVKDWRSYLLKLDSTILVIFMLFVNLWVMSSCQNHSYIYDIWYMSGDINFKLFCTGLLSALVIMESGCSYAFSILLQYVYWEF